MPCTVPPDGGRADQGFPAMASRKGNGVHVWIVLAVMALGVNTLVWGGAGIVRCFAERRAGRCAPRPAGSGRDAVGREDVAVLMAAHNEDAVLGDALDAVMDLVEPRQVHVVSDGSTDGTAALARGRGARVLELTPNRGKAGALAAGIGHFGLSRDYRVVLLLDADTRLSSEYLDTGLPAFDDPAVAAVAGCARTMPDPPSHRRWGRVLLAYRERLYIAVQWLFKYGQAAAPVDVVPIVPGFASMYRAEVIDRIEVAATGLVIEDFNMTFEVHAKRLGRIAFHPYRAVARTQDPVGMRDYVRQVQRWMLGFWQTLRRHGLIRGRFGVAVAVYVTELIAASVLLLLLAPLAVVWAAVAAGHALGAGDWAVVQDVVGVFPPHLVAPGVLIADYALTVLAAAVARRPAYLVLGLAFPLLRMLDAALCLKSLALAFRSRSDGRWTSPGRRAMQPPSAARRADAVPGAGE